MKNVKLGFEFGLGMILAKVVWSMPVALKRPEVKQALKRVKVSFERACGQEVEEKEEEERTDCVFGLCKQRIGF